MDEGPRLRDGGSMKCHESLTFEEFLPLDTVVAMEDVWFVHETVIPEDVAESGQKQGPSDPEGLEHDG